MGLTLTRKIGESFTIGDDIEITVIEFSGAFKGEMSIVRILIEAPLNMRIMRTNNKKKHSQVPYKLSSNRANHE